MFRRRTLWLLAILILPACIRANVTPYQTLAPTTADQVQVFSERVPNREFDEIGLIEVEGGQVVSYGKLIQRAQQEAAKIGADAIIVSRRPIKSASGLVIDGPLPGVAVQETETPRIWVVPIIWAQDGDR